MYNVHDIVILNGTTSCQRHTMSEVYDVVSFRCYDIVCLRHDVVHMKTRRRGYATTSCLKTQRRLWSTYQMIEAGKVVQSVVVSWSKLISWSWKSAREVHAWSLVTLARKHALQQCKGAFTLVSAGGEMWGGVRKELVVWGRE